MKINFVRKNKRAVMPFKAHITDAGFDLTAVECIYNPQTKVLTCDTGLKIDIPKGYVLKLFPRSSIYKTGLVLSNGVGVGDSGYTGTYKANFYAVGPNPRLYAPGDKICQVMVEKLEEVEWNEAREEELPEYERGDRGFGSSGR
jgi:dUTP pyrophosphatase